MKQPEWPARFMYLNWWIKSEDILLSRLSSRSIWKIFVVFAVFGVSMRLYTQAQPSGYIFHAYDFQSYLMVARSISESSNPYSTGRYNYGPIWAIIVWLVKSICGDDISFRLGLASLLILTDLGISLWLKKNGYLLASLFLLLSPISIAITARHLQFDNLAVLFALLSVNQISRVKTNLITKHDVFACLLLSLSLMTKHIFIIFPFWLALRQTSVKKKSLYLFLPPVIFLMSLMPFWFNNSKSVSENVISYSSLKNAPFLYAILPDGLVDSLINSHLATPIFLLIVGLVGFRLKHLPIIQLPLVYMVTFVVFSSAIADQYLAIPVAAALVFLNLGFLLWLAIVAVYFAGNQLTQNWWGFRSVWNWIARDWIPYSAPDWMGLYRDQFVFLFIGWLLLMNCLRKTQNSEKELVHQRTSQIETQKYKHLYLVFLIPTLVLSLPLAFNLLPTTQSIRHSYEQNARYEGVKINAVEPLCSALINGNEINIHISGNITELYSYQNLFQTSDLNAGIRLEINDAGEAGLLIGSNGVDGFSLVLVPGKFEVGKFDVSIRIRDGKKVMIAFQNKKTEKVISGLKPKCDNVVIGYGYDSSRVIKGEVQFIASAPYSVPRFVPRWIDSVVRADWVRALVFLLFCFTLFFVTFKVSAETKQKVQSTREEQNQS